VRRLVYLYQVRSRLQASLLIEYLLATSVVERASLAAIPFPWQIQPSLRTADALPAVWQSLANREIASTGKARPERGEWEFPSSDDRLQS
jgi:hypothetical protein